MGFIFLILIAVIAILWAILKFFVGVTFSLVGFLLKLVLPLVIIAVIAMFALIL
ncbi:MAG: hypothetical protein MJ162_04240 [Treponema sp.]|nr:hypothetical protein [Treponema sp.]